MQNITDFFFGSRQNHYESQQQQRRIPDQIKVLRRPVGSNINMIVEVATHVYLGYFENGRLVDSLSFDPNEGDGIRDPLETSNNELLVIEGSRRLLNDYWRQMKQTRQGFQEEYYRLQSWNCGHVAAYLLDQCNTRPEDQAAFKAASKWALAANKVANIRGKDAYEIYRDGPQKKNQ
jgi:hypothetical protein